MGGGGGGGREGLSQHDLRLATSIMAGNQADGVIHDVITGAVTTDNGHLLHAARGLVSQGKLDEACHAYKEAIRLCPTGEGVSLSLAWRELGEVMLLRGKKKAGMYCFQKAVDSAREASNEGLLMTAMVRLALESFVQGYGEGAMTLVGEACQLDRNAAAPLALRGLLWRAKWPSRDKQAKDNFDKASHLRPNCPIIQRIAGIATT